MGSYPRRLVLRTSVDCWHSVFTAVWCESSGPRPLHAAAIWRFQAEVRRGHHDGARRNQPTPPSGVHWHQVLPETRLGMIEASCDAQGQGIRYPQFFVHHRLRPQPITAGANRVEDPGADLNALESLCAAVFQAGHILRTEVITGAATSRPGIVWWRQPSVARIIRWLNFGSGGASPGIRRERIPPAARGWSHRPNAVNTGRHTAASERSRNAGYSVRGWRRPADQAGGG